MLPPQRQVISPNILFSPCRRYAEKTEEPMPPDGQRTAGTVSAPAPLLHDGGSVC